LRLCAILSVFAVAFPPVSLLAPKGTVPLLLLATVLGAAAAWRSGRRPAWPPAKLLAAVGAFLAWGFASAAWSLDPGQSLITGAKVGGVLLAGFAFFALAGALDDAERVRVLRWLTYGLLATLALITVEAAFQFPIYRLIVGADGAETLPGEPLLPVRYNRGATLLALVIWPALALLRRGSGPRALVLFAALIIAVAVSQSAAAVVALAAGGAVWIVARVAPRMARALVILAPVVALVGSPLAARGLQEAGAHESDWLFRNARHRVEIWIFSREMIAGRPILGWGLDTAATISDLNPRSESSGLPLMPVHPHNAALQVLLELGVVGGALALLPVLLIVSRINRTAPAGQPELQASFVGVLVIAMVSFGAWQAHWLATIFAVATLAALCLPASGSAAQQGQTGRAGRERVRG